MEQKICLDVMKDWLLLTGKLFRIVVIGCYFTHVQLEEEFVIQGKRSTAEQADQRGLMREAAIVLLETEY